MKKECIRVYYKRPGKNLIEVKIPNELEWIQGAVEGYFEAVTLKPGENGMPDLVMLCNEEGKLRRTDPNFRLLNDMIVGPVLFVGQDGEEYTDCPMNKRELEMALWLAGVSL